MAKRKTQRAISPNRVESSLAARTSGFAIDETRFKEVLELIEAARRRAYQSVNSELVGLYWSLGEYISKKIAAAEWGDGVVDELAAAIARKYPGMRGYTRPNLFRMRQFYEAYRGNEKVSALLRQLPWTHHLVILGQTKPPDEVVEYALARTSSPTLVAEHQTMLPPKEVLRRKLHELYTELASDAST